MTSVIGDFVERVDFNSYEDFYKNFKLKYDICNIWDFIRYNMYDLLRFNCTKKV